MEIAALYKAEHILGLNGLGFATAADGTVIGAGGGFVLMPLLLQLYLAESPEILTSISLAVVFFNAFCRPETYPVIGHLSQTI